MCSTRRRGSSSRRFSAPTSGRALRRDDRRRRGTRRAVQLSESDTRFAGDLAVARLAAQLPYQFMNLAQAGRADRLAVGDQAAVGVDRHRATDLRRTVGQQLLLLAVLAETAL